MISSHKSIIFFLETLASSRIRMFFGFLRFTERTKLWLLEVVFSKIWVCLRKNNLVSFQKVGKDSKHKDHYAL